MTSVLEMLEAVGIDRLAIDAAIGESTEIRYAVMEKAKEVQEYWKEIAPVNKTGKPHTLTSGYVDDPGDYRDSINIKYVEGKTGHFMAIVGTQDYKALWLEYGSIHNPEHGFGQRTSDRFGGKTIEREKSKDYIVSA